MMPIETLIENLKLRSNDDLPGEFAQNLMLAKPRSNVSFPKSNEHAIPSAVLILLYPQTEELHFLLTERTNEVSTHKGQISLPGGAWEQGEQLYETALRETEEELGISTDTIEIIDELTPLFVKITGYMIHPFVGFTKASPKIVPHAGEVHNVFNVSLSDLINPSNQTTELWTIRDIPVDVPFFQFEKYKVWGATAMILSEFRICLQELL